MFRKLSSKKVLLIAFILLLFVAIPSSFAEDSSATDIGDVSLTSAYSDLSLADQSNYQSDDNTEINNEINPIITNSNSDSSSNASGSDSGSASSASGSDSGSASSASDLIGDNLKSSNPDADKLSESGNWIIEESGDNYDSLSEAITNAPDGSTIISSGSIDETLNNITISKNITIKAVNRGDVTLRVNGKNAFTLQRGNNLFLSNLVFTGNVNSQVRGGIVYAYGNVTLNNTQIINLYASGTYCYGSVVYCRDVSGLSINVIDSYFENIVGSQAPFELSDTKLYVNNSVFRNLRSTGSACAIYMYGSNASIENSVFADASTSSEYIYATNSNINISSSVFRNLTTSDNCAGLYTTNKANATVYNCIFDSCKSTTYSSDAAGAIFSEGNYINISYSTFKNCNQSGLSTNNYTTRYFAGAVLADEGDVNYCIFLNNSKNPSSSQKAYAFTDLYLDSGNADNNYWGVNAGPDEDMTNKYESINSWYVLTMDAADVVAGYDAEIIFNLNKINVSNNLINGRALQDINLTVTPTLSGTESYDLSIVRGTGSITYNSADSGDETLSIDSVSDEFDFVVSADAFASIYVAEDGSNDNSGIETSPYQTIAYALSQVTETRNIIYIKPGTYNESDLMVDKSVSIVTLGAVTIDAKENGRIFIVDDNVDFVLRDIALVNGKTDGDGGAINVISGNLTLNNVTIKGSSALNGGAVAISGSFNIFDSQFKSNTASGDGGAIYIKSGASTLLNNGINRISNTNFTSNSANNGGAVASYDALTLKSSRLADNTALINGGAIFISNGNDLNISIDGSIFTENIAENGGAVYLSNSNKNISIINNIFIENTASGYGGALDLKEALAYLSNNNMGGNEAADGNSIYLDNSKINAILSFLDSKVINASVGDVVTLNATVYDDMNNTVSGGQVTFTVNGEEISSAAIIEGLATSQYLVDQIYENDLIVSGSYAGLSQASSINNGFIHTVTNNWFIEGGNSYETLADAVSNAANGDVIYGIPGTYENSQFIVIDKDLTIKALEKDTVFLKGVNNQIFNITRNVTFNLINLTLSNGASKGYGGLIEGKGTLNIINSTLKDAAISGSYAQGGAIFMWENSQLNIIGSEFKNLSASYYGGAIYMYSTGSKLNVINSSFNNISGGRDGFIIYSRSPVSINGSNFTNSKGPFYIGSTSNYYGAVYVGSNLTVDNSRFVNITGPRASVLCVDDSLSIMNVYHSVFVNNTALNTTIWSRGSYNTINYCIFANNTGINGNYWDFMATGYYLAGSDLNYNYWESNEGPYYNYNDNKASMDYWAILDMTVDEDMLLANSENYIDVKFNRYTDGENYYNLSDLNEYMPDYVFALNATSGTIDAVVDVVNGEGTAHYTAPNENTHVKICIEPSDVSVEFDVMKTESLIYVSNSGSDLTGDGSYESPYGSIGYALSKVSDTRNIIYLEEGTYNEHDLDITKSVTIQGKSLSRTIINAQGQGNIFNINTPDIEVIIDDLTLINGKAVNGGAIFANAGTLTLYNTVISSSEAENGGAIFIGTNAKVYNNTIINIAGSSNGAIYLNSSSLNLTENIMSDVPDNAIYVNGGSLNAVIIYLNNSTVEIPRSTSSILNATVTDDMGNPINGGSLGFRFNGGLIGTADVVNGSASIEYTVPYSENTYRVTGSYSNGDEYAIVKNGAVRTIKLGWFIGDNGFETLEQAVAAADDGDTIIAVPGTYNVGHIELNKNINIKANESGTVVLHMVERYFIDVTDVEIGLEGLIIENANGYQGYFINNYYGIVNVENCTFRDSNLSTTFGVVYTSYGELNVNNSNFVNLKLTDATSSDYGGAIAAYYSNVNINNSRFENDQAGSYGGALYLYSYSVANISNTSFINCSSIFRGGAIYAGGESELMVVNSTFINNTANSYGGAICAERANITSLQSVYINNTGASRGGAIYVARNATINYNIFINNNAGVEAGNDVYFYWYNYTYPDEFVDVDYNYWGTNDGPSVFNINEFLSASRWTILEVSINSTEVILGPEYSIDINFNRFQYGNGIYDLEDVMPDFDLDLSAALGEISSEKITVANGTASAIYTPVTTGNETITFSPSPEELKFAVEFGSDFLLSSEIKSATTNLSESKLIIITVLDKFRHITEDLSGKNVIVNYETPRGNYSLPSKVISGSTFEFNLIELAGVEAGDSVIISFALEDGTIDATSDSIRLSINKFKTSLNTDGSEINSYVGSGSLDVGLFNDDAPVDNKEIEVIIKSNDMESNNSTYHYVLNTSSNGIASFDLKDIVYGEYTVNILFRGDDNYLPASKSIILNVNKINTLLNVSDVSASEGKGSLNISLLANATSGADSSEAYLIADSNLPVNVLLVSVEINQSTGLEEVKVIKNITELTVNGMLNIDLSDLTYGNYTAIISFAGDDKYNPSNAEAKVDIYSQVVKFEVEFSNSTNILEVTFMVNDVPVSGRIVTVEAGSYYETLLTNREGKASFDLSDLVNGEYTVIVSFDGDNDYPSNHTYYDLIVTQGRNASGGNGSNGSSSDTNGSSNVVQSTQIVASNMVTYAINTKVDGKKGKYFNIYLKDSKGNAVAGKKLNIGFNGKTYLRTTDKNGRVRFQINLRYIGTYTFAIAFIGDDSYGGSLKMAKVTVKRQKVKLKAKKVSLKAKAKRKILKATLKTSRGKAIKGKKVIFKIKGKKYTAKTNKKGIAKVKIKLSKKGKYKYTVKVAADKTYAKKTIKRTLRLK